LIRPITLFHWRKPAVVGEAAADVSIGLIDDERLFATLRGKIR